MTILALKSDRHYDLPIFVRMTTWAYYISVMLYSYLRNDTINNHPLFLSAPEGGAGGYPPRLFLWGEGGEQGVVISVSPLIKDEHNLDGELEKVACWKIDLFIKMVPHEFSKFVWNKFQRYWKRFVPYERIFTLIKCTFFQHRPQARAARKTFQDAE